MSTARRSLIARPLVALVGCLSSLPAMGLDHGQLLSSGPAATDGAAFPVWAHDNSDRGSNPTGCGYAHDDGSLELAVGLIAGGEMAWLNRFTTIGGCERIAAVFVAWNHPLVPGVPDGTPAKVYVWDDPDDDGNPINAVLVSTQPVSVQNAGTGILNRYVLDVPATVSGVFFVGTSVVHVSGQYPAAMDSTTPYVAGSSWFAGSTAGTFNAANLAANLIPPSDIAGAGFPAFWMVRADATTGVTYQGRLLDGGSPVNGAVDFRFQLFDSPSGGASVGSAIELTGVAVAGGLFTVNLPFDSSRFDEGRLYLEISVGDPLRGGAFVTLSPRQPLTPTPFAYRANKAGAAELAAVADTAAYATLANRATGLSAPDGDPAQAVVVDNAGNVGVGTAAPGARLHVSGGPAFYQMLVDDASPAGTWLHLANSSTGGGQWSLVSTGSGNTEGAGRLLIRDTSTPAVRMLFDTNGNIGIGTLTPTARLQIAVGNLRFRGTGSSIARIDTAWDLMFEKNFDNTPSDDSWFRWFTDGTTIENMRILNGDEASILGDGPFVSNGIDYAEAFKAESDDLEPGDVVSLAIGNWEYCRRASSAYDAHLVGVVSTQPAFVAGLSFNSEEQADEAIAAERRAVRDQLAAGRGTLPLEQLEELGRQEKQLTMALSERARQVFRPIALAGRVPTKVDGRYGPIRAGDRLTSSPTPGHAMKQTQPGMSVGVALEDFHGPGAGSIMILVQPGWYGGMASAEAQAAADLAALRSELDALRSALQKLQATLDAGPE